MTKRFLAVSNWVDKATGLPKSTVAEIKEGVNKNGHAYQITDTESTMQLDETLSVGTIIRYTMTRGEVDKQGK
ncbi:MAG: hypothetical protein LBI19_03195 [Oscillospiraceae bacterium]|jgi:hypothetical protein|nr:hypothetical protein [Oscillospiraceae bacterium]